MAANDNLHPGQFPPPGPVYHGSGHGFAVGDTVNPTPDYTHMGGESAAFGTIHPSVAGIFSLERARESFRHGPNREQLPTQGQLFTSVYEVGPKSPEGFQLHPSDQKSYDTEVKYRKDYQPMPEPPANNMPIDRQGFEVKRHHGFAYPEWGEGVHSDMMIRANIQETP